MSNRVQFVVGDRKLREGSISMRRHFKLISCQKNHNTEKSCKKQDAWQAPIEHVAIVACSLLPIVSHGSL